MQWKEHARDLAEHVASPASRWYEPVASVPRHLFVPRWWSRAGGDGWFPRSGPGDVDQWRQVAYADRTLVTRVGVHHADTSPPSQRHSGRPTSEATLPSLTVRMLELARVQDGDTLLDVGTGTGYSAALACKRLGEDRVHSIDVDSYLTDVAQRRLAGLDMWPDIENRDATGPLPGVYDRIVSTVGVRPVPASWLEALKPGGRLVTPIEGTSLIITAVKQDDGTAIGRVEWERAAFMPARHGVDYPIEPRKLLASADGDSDDATVGRYPVIDIAQAWDLAAMLAISVPGVVYDYKETGLARVVRMAHPDGSWARAIAAHTHPPAVHQGGPRNLWDTLDELRTYWLEHGELPLRDARVLMRPDGATQLACRRWRAEL